MRGGLDPLNDRLWVRVWGGVAILAFAALIGLWFSLEDGSESSASDPEQVVAAVVSPLGAIASASGEGLTTTALTARAGKTETTDGGNEVPRGTVDGPGRRVFAGVTIRLPRSKREFLLRQITAQQLGLAERLFVRWDGYLAIVRSGDSQAGPFTWRKIGPNGVRVPADSVVRLRTMFRIPVSAARCVGPELPQGVAGHRASVRLERAPAWLIRGAATNEKWRWLKSDNGQGGLSALRSGPSRPVLFRSAHVCARAQPSMEVNPDPGLAEAAQANEGDLPLESPDTF